MLLNFSFRWYCELHIKNSVLKLYLVKQSLRWILNSNQKAAFLLGIAVCAYFSDLFVIFFCWKIAKKLKSNCKGQKSFFNANLRVNYFSEEEGNFVNLRLFLYWELLLIHFFWPICHFFFLQKNDKKSWKMLFGVSFALTH